jgi:hypothetical protein
MLGKIGCTICNPGINQRVSRTTYALETVKSYRTDDIAEGIDDTVQCILEEWYDPDSQDSQDSQGSLHPCTPDYKYAVVLHP